MYTNTIEKTLDSREVAEMVGKAHNKLMRDIREYCNQLAQSKIGHGDFFIEGTYHDTNNQERPCYLVTRKGCEFIAHKLTGVKGTEFTAKYINRFHEMEDKLKKSTAEPEKIISARELAAMLKRKQCKVCYRIDGLLERHPEYAAEFVSGTFRNAQGRVFRTYELTEKGLELFVNLLEKDGDRNSYNTVKGIQRIKDLHPGIQTKRLPSGAGTEVSTCPRTALKELQKAEAVLEMFERCYLGMDFAEFDAEDRERFDSALCLLHDQVRQAVDEAKGA